MNGKDVEIIQILQELGLRKEPDLTADQEQLFQQAIGEGEVVDFTSRLQKKQTSEFDTKMQTLADEIPQKFVQQQDIVQQVKDAVGRVEDKGACTKAIFKYPTLLSGYKKGTNPVKSIFYAYTDKTDPNHKFARQVVAQIKDKLISAIDIDIASFEALKPLTKNSTAPQHPLREISGAVHEYTVMKNYFQR
jgi:hypothetical protein